MAIYYVKLTGSNVDPPIGGLSEATAWQTLTFAANKVAAGDIVYIAPGTYREAFITKTAGDALNPIAWIGDPNCEHFDNENPGYVRVTVADADEIPSDNYSIQLSHDYNNFTDLVADGISTGSTKYGFYAPGRTGCHATRVMSHGGTGGFYGGILESCVGIGVSYGAIYLPEAADKCLFIASSYALYNSDANNCILMAGAYGYRNGAATNRVLNNCTIIGSYYGTYMPTSAYNVALNNCVSINSFLGITGVNTTVTATNCVAIGCAYAGYGLTSGSQLDVSGITAIRCGNACRGGLYDTGDATVADWHVGWLDNLHMIEKFYSAFRFNLDPNPNIGDDLVLVGTEDIVGNPRRTIDGTIGVGAYSFTKKEPEWTNYKTVMPAIKIYQIGVETISFTAKAGVAKTISVWVKFNLDGGINKPQLILEGDSIATQTDTATGDGSTWEELVVSATPSTDGILKIKLYSRDTGNSSSLGSYSIFSDISIG